MSTAALTSALSGLRVAQQALDLTANNISNAGTEGYTRKTLPQEATFSVITLQAFRRMRLSVMSTNT